MYDRSRGALRAHSLISGFTLIEVVVVLLILSIILGLASMRLTRDESDVLRDEARRLALVLQNAQQQAILEGRPYAFQFVDGGYRFLTPDKNGKLVPIQVDELLAPHRLPRPLAIAPSQPHGKMNERNDPILFDPSGEFPAFTIVLTADNLVWYVQGMNDGKILSSSTPERST
ncbi:MAG: GspH/FimT family protein [Sulfurifustis sp.]